MSSSVLTEVIPFLTILIVWLGSALSNRQGMKTLEAKIDGLEKKMDARIDGLEKRLDARIDGLEQKMDARFEAVNARFDAIEQRLGRLEVTVDRIDNEIRKDHEHRITLLEAAVRQLQSAA